MKTHLPQIVIVVLLACASMVCVYAQQQGNTRRGDYGFGTRNAPRTTTEYYTTKKVVSEKSDRHETATTPAVPSVSGKIIEWSNDGVCEFRTDSGDKYHVCLWLVDMPKEGQPNYEEMMEFIRSHPVYGEGCGNVKLRIIAENPDKPEYKIGILTVSSSSSCQKTLWGSGYCGLDDDEHELERNSNEATKLQRIFSSVQKEKDAPKVSPVADSAEEPTDDDEAEGDAEETPSEYEEWCKIIKDDHSENLIDIIHALDGGLDPNAVRDDGSGHTILHNVVWEDKRLPVIIMLLDNGADPNAVRTDGSSVLRLCIAGKRDEAGIANILCDYGADVNHKDKDGKTLLDLAVAKNRPNTGRVLVAYGAKCTRMHKNMDTPAWKDILKRPQTRTPKNTGLVRKPKNTETSQKSVAAGEGGGGSITGFGSKIRRNNALEGILFDLKHTNKGVELATGAGNNSGKRREQLHKAIGILDNSWRVELLKKEYAVAPTQRYTTSIFIADSRGGPLDANKATEAFASPFLAPGWLCYYEGYFGVPEAGEYRFVGMGDDAMIVGVDKKTVLYAFWPGEGHGRCVKYVPGWEPDNFCGPAGTDGRGTFRGATGHRNMLYKGSWLKLVPNKRYFIQVAFGEAAGGKAGAWLGIQKKDRDTDTDFPLFTLERMRPDPQLQISEHGRYNTSCVFKAPQK